MSDGPVIQGENELDASKQNIKVTPDGELKAVLSGYGFTGVPHNRNIAAAATTYAALTNSQTWTVGENVKQVSLNAIALVVAGLQNDEACLVVVNAPSDAIANTWLNDAGAVGVDVLYDVFYPTEPLIIQRTTPITRIDVLPLNVAMRIIIASVGVLT